jgi:tetratricopeptide (TPR) repeat protein
MTATKQNKRQRNRNDESSISFGHPSLTVGRALLLISLLSVLAYANSLGGDFVFDDTEQIVDNQNVRSWENLSKAFTTHVWEFRERPGNLDVPPPLPYYRPLFTIMLTTEFHLFGLWPQGWHLVSLLLHTLCAIGVFYVILQMSGRGLLAFFSAILFAVHPVHAESVSWISGMTDPLFGVFFLSSFYFFIKAHSSVDALDKRKAFVWSLMLFVISAFAKETALGMIVLVFGFQLTRSEVKGMRRLTESAKTALPYLVVALVYLIPRYLVLGDAMWKNPQAPNRPLTYTLLTLPFVTCSYLIHLLWPVGLSVTYNTHFITSVASPGFILASVVLMFFVTALFICRRRVNREVWRALLLVFVPLLPVLNLGQVSREEYLVFDHYLYISVAGLGYLAALGIEKLGAFQSKQSSATIAGLRRPKLAIGLFAVVALGSTAFAARANRPWADSYSLWSNVARVRPNYWAAYYNVGLALLNAKRFDDARESLVRAAELKPDESNVADALGRAYDGLNDTPDAIASFKRAIEIDPKMFESYNNLGAVYFKGRDYKSAEANFATAIQLRPQATATRFNLGLCYSREGRYRDATREFERVVQLTPDDAEAFYEMGLAYENTGRVDDAVRALRLGQGVAKSRELAGKMSESLRRLQREGRQE